MRMRIIIRLFILFKLFIFLLSGCCHKTEIIHYRETKIKKDGSQTKSSASVTVTTDCGGRSRFEEKFAKCKPAKMTLKLTDNLIYYYEIMGTKDGLCELKEKFLANFNPEWMGKEMTCRYDNSKKFDIAIEGTCDCRGPLYDVITGQDTVNNNSNENKLFKVEIIERIETSPQYINVNSDKNRLIKEEIIKKIETSPKRLTSLALTKVFSATFYQVKIITKHPNGPSQSYETILARKDEAFVNIENPYTNMPMPNLKTLIRSDFHLETDEDAIILQEAFEQIYPSFSLFDEKVEETDIRHSNNEWLLIRGKFFDRHKGFIIKNDKKGAITYVSYSLEIQ